MVKTRKERAGNAHVKLRQPDRSGPTEKTLLDFAHEQNLFQQVQQREKEMAKERRKQSIADADDDDGEVPTLSPGAERALEAALWTATIAMLHFTFDVLVQHQYGQEISWAHVCTRTGRAWLGLPTRYQRPLRQSIFFIMGVASGCYLIYISNTYGYLATMKQAPPLGCLWLWAVVELDLVWGCLSLLLAAVFLKQGGYEIK
ncbi:deacetylase-like protein, partial [Metarhizium majus ARSEF 297]